jgi:WD40 repeat protein
MSDVNSKFLAVITEEMGGGAFLIINLENTGRVDLNHPKVSGHQAAVLDVMFCPFNDNIIASGGEDCLVKVWEIPEGGLTENLDESLVDLEGHQRRIGIVLWHPTAENILLSAGFDYIINIWDIAQATAVKQIACHTDTIFSVDWNFDGSLLATTSKDKKIRVIDPRAEAVISEGSSHDGTKAARVVFVGEKNWMFTTGFSRMSERQYGVWKPDDLSKPMKLEMIDTGSGVRQFSQ